MKRLGRWSAFVCGVVLAGIILSGCTEPTAPYEYRREVVVNATLVAGQPIDSIMLTWTGTADGYYDPRELGIAGALVIVSEVGGPFIDTLMHDPTSPGTYYPSDPLSVIQPMHTYDLLIVTPNPDSRVVTGRTTVPDTFSITHSTLSDGDTVRYDLTAPVNTFAWSPSRIFGAYLPTVTTLDPNAALIPKAFYDDTASADFDRPDHIVYRIGLPKAQTHTELPWVFLNYFGRTRFDVFAVDENLSDFLNQWLALQTGELKEIRYHLRGGIGLFCAKSRAENGLDIYLTE